MIKLLDKVLDKVVSFTNPKECSYTFEDRVIYDHDIVTLLKKGKRLKWYDHFRLQKVVTEVQCAFTELATSEPFTPGCESRHLPGDIMEDVK